MSISGLNEGDALLPEGEDECASFIVDALAKNISISIVGGDTRQIGSLSDKPQARLSTSKLSGIVDYEPAEMVMIAKAGTPVSEIQAELDKGGQRMIFEPLDYRQLLGTTGEPTVGGIAATNASGPRRFTAGAARDSLLGARFVNGKGDVVKAGGRVMKNVTGLDLVKLLAGSWGTLGVMSEVTFKVVPQVECDATLVIHGLSDEGAATAMAAAMATSCEVSGAAHLPELVTTGLDALASQSATLLRLEGFENSVRLRLEKLRDVLSDLGEQSVLENDASQIIWRSIRDVMPFADGTDTPVWRISVAPMAGHKLISKIAHNGAFYDWQGGLVWLRMTDEPNAEQVRSAVEQVGGGHATLVRASIEQRRSVEVFQPEPAPVAALSKRIRAQFDPYGLFDAGRML